MNRLSSFMFAALALWLAPQATQAAEAELDLAVDIAVAEGSVTAEQAPALREMLQLAVQGGKSACPAADETCRAELRTQLGTCYREERAHGVAEAAAVTTALMQLGAGDAAALTEAGELVRLQLQRGWTPSDLSATAEALAGLGERQRWRTQARELLGECVSASTCDGARAGVALRAMRQLANRANVDPRHAQRTIRLTLRDTPAHGATDSLARRLRQRLRLHNGEVEAATGGEQHRHRYRHQMNNEAQRGGNFGGEPMQGTRPGVGAGPGGRR